MNKIEFEIVDYGTGQMIFFKQLFLLAFDGSAMKWKMLQVNVKKMASCPICKHNWSNQKYTLFIYTLS